MIALATIGSDPEYFVQKHGKISHAIGLLGGTKNSPRPITFDGAIPTGFVQEDNVLVEFNTTPTDNADQFASHMREVLSATINLLPHGMLNSAISSHSYSDEELAALPKSAFVFGCEPDVDAYTSEDNPAPKVPKEQQGFRSAGGHVHIGFAQFMEDGLMWEDACQVGQMCDITLGLWGVLHGDDVERKKLYGKAGSIRVKPYGVEYRTLGNFWIWSSAHVKEVHRRAQLAFSDRHRLKEIHQSFPPAEIQRVINTGDENMATFILETVGYL